jgi:hypothetical protein
MKKIDEMTPEELRIACAEKCGWLNVRMVDDICLGIHEGEINGVPAYDTDHNALLELIMTVPEEHEKRDDFIFALGFRIPVDNEYNAGDLLHSGYIEDKAKSAYALLTANPIAIMQAFLEIMCDNLAKDLSKQTTQEETIVWHKYPDNKPEENGEYLVNRDGSTSILIQISDFYVNSGFSGRGFGDVIAYAKLPKGYKEK